MAALTVTTDCAEATGDARLRGPSPVRSAGPAAADRSGAATRTDQGLRSWPLLVLAAPAAAEVWSGWVGIAQMTGFGLVSPLPGIWPSLHLDTAITLPIGVEAYAAYALRAWLARDPAISVRTRGFAKWSAISSFVLGMAGQVAYHLMAQAGMARAPWAITTVVSCLPVLVLAMGTALAHMLRADAEATDTRDSRTRPPATLRTLSRSPQDQDRPGRMLADLHERIRQGQIPPPQAWPETDGPPVIAMARHDPQSQTVSFILDATTANIALFAIAGHADEREAHLREVECSGQNLPEGSYGRRNRQAIAARETRIATRLRAVEQAYRTATEHDTASRPPEPTRTLRSPERQADREIELE